MTASSGAVLEAARVQSGMAEAELWLAYFALGGMASPQMVQSILDGTLEPSEPDYDVLVQALNERFMDGGYHHPVPYGDEVD